VAVVFNPQSSEQLSEALISMNNNFKNACKDGIITPEELKNLYKTAKSIYYPKRTYNLILEKSDIPTYKKNLLKEYIGVKGKDIKREDAILVLNYIKDNFT
ncbi:MAG TPA: TfuA-like protein, partial [Methanobacterium sp.]|nr:TfuA-like protein [Methanobacterium sp.]